MASLRTLLHNARRKSGYDRLESRERLFLLLGVVFVVCFLIFQMVITPYLEARQILERSLQRRQNELLEMSILQKEYQDLMQRQGVITRRIEQRSPQFSLFSFLEQQTTAVKVRNRVTSMKPATTELEDGLEESSVEIKLDGITLKQLVDFLVRVESEENVILVKRLAVQKNQKESDLLDVVMNVVTFNKTDERPR
jgi:type II secretory pathway component PulM